MISYSQNFEDVILNRVFRGRDHGFYIDVGAADPVVDSVTKFFYDEGWSGINIEPNEWFYNKLVRDRPRDINLNVAIGEREEEKELYLFERIGNSTFEETSRDRYIESGFETKPVMVKTYTLAAICDQYVSGPVDFLKIDCEGWEKFAVKSGDWDRFRPAVLVVEATEPGTANPSWEEWEPFLLDHARYEMVYFDGLNRFYLSRESADLRGHFELPPNVHDGFRVYAMVAMEQAHEALQRDKQDLQRDRDGLRTQMVELEERIRSNNDEIQHLRDDLAAARALASQLDEKLLKTRLWVGQLSQELAASRKA